MASPGPAPVASPAPDIDADGMPDDADAFPEDPTETVDTDGDATGDHADAFPHDAREWADSDLDGIGDNMDQYPVDPGCHSDPCLLPAGGLAPAVAAEQQHPWELSKLWRSLPEQGYDEHSRRQARHSDGRTFTGDWQDEFFWKDDTPSRKALEDFCVRHPKNTWCRRLGADSVPDDSTANIFATFGF